MLCESNEIYSRFTHRVRQNLNVQHCVQMVSGCHLGLLEYLHVSKDKQGASVATSSSAGHTLGLLTADAASSHRQRERGLAWD